MNIKQELPFGWALALIDDAIAILADGKTLQQGWSPQCEKEPCDRPEEWGVLKTTAIQAGEYQGQHHKRLPAHLSAKDAIEVTEGDLLLTCAGPRVRCGVACLVKKTRPRLMFSGKMYRFRAVPGATDARYIEVFLQTEEAQTAIDRMKTGGNDSGLNLTHDRFRQLEIKLAPYSEQCRIVEKLEELLSDLDAGVAELKAAQKKLEKYRQSLLKAAVDGTLTASWREVQRQAGSGPAETGAQLLERILAERRARWETKQLAKFEEQGRRPLKDWQEKYSEPIIPDVTALPKLPQGWIWASLDMLGDIVSGVAKGTKREADIVVREVPYLRVANVQRGYLDLGEIKTIAATEKDIEELTLQDGDVLFNEGGDRDKLGRGWVWRDEVKECIHQNHVFRMRPYLREIVPELVSYHGNTFGKFWFQAAGKQTTNLASINMGMLRVFPVPLAPADEQKEILLLLQEQLDALNGQEKAVRLGLKQAAAQRQNILKAAFSGRLVPQDPNDEPAAVLLERIRAERAALAAKGVPRRRGKAAATA